MSHPAGDAIRCALLRLLPELERLESERLEPWLILKRDGPNALSGRSELRPSLLDINRATERLRTELAKPVREAVFGSFPRFGKPIGLRHACFLTPTNDPSYPLNSVLSAIWCEQGSYRPNPAVIDRAVDSALHVFKTGRIKLKCTALLQNVVSEIDSFALTPACKLRRLSDVELTNFYGGAHWELIHQMKPTSPLWVHGYVLETEHEIELMFNREGWDTPPSYQQVAQEQLDRVIVAMRLFKQGPVGYNCLRFRAIGFCPLPLGDVNLHDVYIPLGQYHITKEESSGLSESVRRIELCADTALNMGCRRLSDAQLRTVPEDRLVDAVVGMEAVLLAANRDIQGELSFRFALNYAMLGDSPDERQERYRFARDLYKVRSTVAHGKALPLKNSLGMEKGLEPRQVALRACEALRDVLSRLLPQHAAAPHGENEFWLNLYFGSEGAANKKSPVTPQ